MCRPYSLALSAARTARTQTAASTPRDFGFQIPFLSESTRARGGLGRGVQPWTPAGCICARRCPEQSPKSDNDEASREGLLTEHARASGGGGQSSRSTLQIVA